MHSLSAVLVFVALAAFAVDAQVIRVPVSDLVRNGLYNGPVPYEGIFRGPRINMMPAVESIGTVNSIKLIPSSAIMSSAAASTVSPASGTIMAPSVIAPSTVMTSAPTVGVIRSVPGIQCICTSEVTAAPNYVRPPVNVLGGYGSSVYGFNY